MKEVADHGSPSTNILCNKFLTLPEAPRIAIGGRLVAAETLAKPHKPLPPDP